MRKVALVALVAIGGAYLGSVAWGDPLTVSPSMLNGNAALYAGAVTPSQEGPQGTGLPATVITPRQAMSAEMPPACTDCANAKFGTTIAAKTDPTASAPTAIYGAHLSSTLGAAGVIAAADDQDNAVAANVPSALRLSAVPNSTQSLSGTAPSGHVLGK